MQTHVHISRWIWRVGDFFRENISSSCNGVMFINTCESRIMWAVIGCFLNFHVAGFSHLLHALLHKTRHTHDVCDCFQRETCPSHFCCADMLHNESATCRCSSTFLWKRSCTCTQEGNKCQIKHYTMGKTVRTFPFFVLPEKQRRLTRWKWLLTSIIHGLMLQGKRLQSQITAAWPLLSALKCFFYATRFIPPAASASLKPSQRVFSYSASNAFPWDYVWPCHTGIHFFKFFLKSGYCASSHTLCHVNPWH